MFDQFKNLAGMMSQAKELREKFEQLQQELVKITAEGDAGAGAVRVTINGKFEVLGVRLDRPLIQALAGAGEEADQAIIEELIAAAFNDAVAKIQQLLQAEMSRLTGGLNLPGLPGLPGFGS